MGDPLHLRFPFNRADCDAIGEQIVRLSVEEIPFESTATGIPAPSAPPESLVICFSLPSPLKLPQVRPIFPGQMAFILDPSLKDQLGKPEDFEIDEGGRLSDSTYENLPKRGMILVRATPRMAKALRDHAIPALGEAPLAAWYGPVELTREFLEESLLHPTKGLKRGEIWPGISSRAIPPSDPDWARYALSGFLQGGYEAPLRTGEAEDGSADDVARLPMPVVASSVAPYMLVITMAWRRSGGDGRQEADPRNPADTSQEIVPTRLFLQHVRTHLVDGRDADPVADKVIGTSAQQGSKPFHDALRADLKTFGFALADRDKDNQYTKLRWALREFQIYATMDRIARARTTPETTQFRSIEAHTNPARYTGWVSGRANQLTRRLIQLWKREHLRCPVVIVGYDLADLDATGQPIRYPEEKYGNLWVHNEMDSNNTCMFAADLSGYYHGNSPATVNLPDLLSIGQYTKYEVKYKENGKENIIVWGGPWARPPSHCRADAELLPTNLCGVTDDALRSPGNEALLSSFKVIRAISELECEGFFDAINAYDDAIVSVGPCHWTAKPKDGELAGFIAYLVEVEKSSPRYRGYSKAIGFFGIGCTRSFAKCRDDKARRYIGPIGLYDDTGRTEPIQKAEDDGAYLRSWHVFYRWVMASRSIPEYTRRMWDMALFRLRDLATTPLMKEDPTATLSQIYSSEQAMALITRWHIFRPSHVVKDGTMGDRLRKAYEDAGAPSVEDASRLQDKLIEALLSHMAKVDGIGDFRQIIAPRWIRDPLNKGINPKLYKLQISLRTLSAEPGSFRLFALPAI
jgi:hypothetical protein